MSGVILHGDARKALSLVEDESVHLVLTSPPYNVEIEYDQHEDDLPWDEWVELLRDVFAESWRTLVPGGRMAVNILHTAQRDPALPMGNVVEKLLLDLPGSYYRGVIMWYKRNANSRTGWGSWDSPSNPVLRGTFEPVYVVSKGPARKDRSGPGDLPKGDYLRASLDVWEITNIANPDHPAPFPVGLVRRMIQFYSWPGDHVLDPFAGSGTTALAAEHLGRSWTAVEISKDYCDLIRKRSMVFEGIPTAEIVSV